tara:strand:+ start:445 stop:687 length:243 start_codon:yes stop_codon:yes gene_type:complete
VFIKYCDPRHAWLQVSLETIKEIGKSVSDYTSFSFIDDEYIYLEEDVDQKLFEQDYGKPIQIQIMRSDNRSRVRDLAHNF